MSGAGVGVARARIQSMDAGVLLDELEASVANVVEMVSGGAHASERWAARLKAFRDLRAEAARLRVQFGAAREAASLREEVAEA